MEPWFAAGVVDDDDLEDDIVFVKSWVGLLLLVLFIAFSPPMDFILLTLGMAANEG